MNKKEHYNIEINLIPKDIISKYDLLVKQINVYVYVRVEKGMYGLVRTWIVAYESLKEYLPSFR